MDEQINIQDKNSINAEIDNNNEQKPENIPENVEKVQEQKEEIQKNENEINDKNDNIQENQNEIKKEDKKENEDKKLDVIEKKEEGKEEEEKEEDTTNEYIIRCEKCLLVPIINIDHTTYKIHYECENKHIKSDINIAQALKETKKISLKKCSSCGETSEEDNFICIQCLKVFCLDGGCKKKHSKENPSHKLININNLDSTCLEHNTSISKYCKDCKKNICVKCQRSSHEGHSFLDLGEILPLNDEIEAGKKLYKTKRDNLVKLKESLKEWLKELNKKINIIMESIDAEILINKNILKSFRTELMNYQMIENFNYFSSKKNIESFSSTVLMSFIKEPSFFNQTLFIAQAISKQEQPIKINTKKETSENIGNNNNKTNKNYNKSYTNINNNNNDNNKIPAQKNLLPTILDEKDKGIERARIYTNYRNRKALPVSQPQKINDKNYYWNLNETKNTNVSKKLFKTNIEITENTYSGIIDNKGIIFLGGDSCLNIYRFDPKLGKIEKEFTIKGLDGQVKTITELKDNYLLVGTSNDTIKILEFLGNKKYRIHQEIRNYDKNSIYKVIELSNYYLVSCDERNIILLKPIKNNYFEIVQKISLNTPTCCILEIKPGLIAATHVVLSKISFYEFKDMKLNLKKEIENIDSTVNNNIMANMNDDFFCSVSKKLVYIFSSKNLELVKKVDLLLESISLFPISCGMILFCHNEEKDEGKNDYKLSLKTFDEKNKTLFNVDEVIVNKNMDKKDEIFYINFFDPNYMIIVSEKNIGFWG